MNQIFLADVRRPRAARCRLHDRTVNKEINKQTDSDFWLGYAVTISQSHLLVGAETTPSFALNACVKISGFLFRNPEIIENRFGGSSAYFVVE
jgi:hypothetical protein